MRKVEVLALDMGQLVILCVLDIAVDFQLKSRDHAITRLMPVPTGAELQTSN